MGFAHVESASIDKQSHVADMNQYGMRTFAAEWTAKVASAGGEWQDSLWGGLLTAPPTEGAGRPPVDHAGGSETRPQLRHFAPK